MFVHSHFSYSILQNYYLSLQVLNLLQPKAGESDTENKDTKPELSKEESKAQATADIKKNQDLLAAQVKMNKNKDEQRKEVLKIQNDLRKRKQELLDKQLSQQKILIEKMSKCKYFTIVNQTNLMVFGF